jgi:hypothetical protein
MKDMVSINKQCLSEKRKTNQNFFKGSLNSDGQQFHNINKTNNNFSTKEGLNSEGQ